MNTSTSKSKISRPSLQSKGFTLLETIIVITLVGILAALITPSWLKFLHTQKAKTAQNIAYQLMGSLASESRKQSLTCHLELTQIDADVSIKTYCGEHQVAEQHHLKNIQLSTCSFPKRKRPFSGSNQTGVKTCAPSVEMGTLRNNNLGSVCFSQTILQQEYCAKYSTLTGGRRKQTRKKRL